SSLSSSSISFFFNEPAPTEIYTLSLHDALPILGVGMAHRERTARQRIRPCAVRPVIAPMLQLRDGEAALCPRDDEAIFKHWCYEDRKSTRLNSSHLVISYAVFCLKKKNKIIIYR